jgi:hypothetical protein
MCAIGGYLCDTPIDKDAVTDIKVRLSINDTELNAIFLGFDNKGKEEFHDPEFYRIGELLAREFYQ